MNKIILAIFVSKILSGCTQFERFNTDKILTDTTGINTANIKLTTNIKNVFIIPKASCISISDTRVNRLHHR